MVTLIDYAWTHPSVSKILSLGASGVVRYLSHDDTKDIHPKEAEQLLAAGLSITLVWELGAARAKEGNAAGQKDAAEAEAKAAELGYPAGLPIFYAVDFDTTFERVWPYLEGVKAASKTYSLGVYGGIKVVDPALVAGLAAYGWQTLAWSGGKVSTRAHLYQDRFTHDYDLNQVLKPFPTWSKAAAPKPAPVKPVEAAEAVGPKPAPVVPPKPAVKHSDGWHADYRWYGQGTVNGNHYDGGNVTVRDARILDAVAAAFGQPIYLTQGGLSSAVAASANTHAGLGAFDIGIRHLTRAQVWKLTAMLLRSGVVAFPRGFGGIRDFFRLIKHIHAVSVESFGSLHPQAQDQVREYKQGGDGLAGSLRYYGPRTPLGTWKGSPYNPANVQADRAVYYVNADPALLGLNVDRKVVAERPRGYKIQAARRVHRWGRWNVVDAHGHYYATIDGLLSREPIVQTIRKP